MAIRKAAAPDGDGELVGSLGNAGILDCWPQIVEFLTATVYEDGSKRTLPTLLLFVEDGRWRLWLHDRDQERSTWTEASELEEALSALEKGLADESITWRRTVPRKRKGGG
jgi:hypothetical protein